MAIGPRPGMVLPALVLAVLLQSCGDMGAGKPLSEHSLPFPVGIAVHQSAGYALVVSSNFDLAHEGGALQVVDLTRLVERLRADAGEPRSDRDYDYHRDLIRGEKAVGLSNFGAGVSLLPAENGGLAAVAARGSNELVLVDLRIGPDGRGGTDIELLCWSHDQRPPGRFPQCTGSASLVPFTQNDPFEVLLVDDAPGGLTALVSFLRNGGVFAVSIPNRSVVGDPPWIEYADIPRVVYALPTDAPGQNGMARSPTTGMVYVTGRTARLRTNPIHYFDPSRGEGASVYRLDLFSTFLGGETRAVDFAADGLTAGLLVRNPNMLAFLDTAPGRDGLPRNSYLGQVVVGNYPSRVRSFENLMFVTCAQDDAVYVVDTRTKRLLDVRENICRGPFDVGFYRGGGLKLALVTCFEDDLIAVIDADADSERFLQVRARIGKPRTND